MDERIEEKANRVRNYLNLLEEIHESKEKSAVVREAKENLIRKSVEAVIDIASRLIALNELRRPDTYADYFQVLKDEGFISETLAANLKEMARFRNLITHQYHTIELKELNTIIDEDLEDIYQFIKSIEQYES